MRILPRAIFLTMPLALAGCGLGGVAQLGQGGSVSGTAAGLFGIPAATVSSQVVTEIGQLQSIAAQLQMLKAQLDGTPVVLPTIPPVVTVPAPTAPAPTTSPVVVTPPPVTPPTTFPGQPVTPSARHRRVTISPQKPVPYTVSPVWPSNSDTRSNSLSKSPWHFERDSLGGLYVKYANK
jgi:hypothetical protein